MSERRIFICYRREDTAGYAGRLYDRLNQRFPDQVFRDLDRIPLLKEWTTVVDESLRSCEVALVLIGQRWLGVSQNGTRRLDEADDPVRREISAVLRRGMKVIPVLIEGAAIPARHELPADIEGLVRWQALRIDDDDFDHDAGRLVSALVEAIETSVPEERAQAAQSRAAHPTSPTIPPAESFKSVLERYQRNWDQSGPFLLPIDDTFHIAGRGTVVTGQVSRGRLRMGDPVEVVGSGAPSRAVSATAIEMSRKLIDEARVGDSCGVLLSDVRQSDVQRGHVLASPGTVSCVSGCTLNMFLLSRADGGLSEPVGDGSSLDLHLHGVDVAATISIQADDRRLHPGRESIVSVTLASPAPLARGMVVAVRRQNESVGVGSIVELSP